VKLISAQDGDKDQPLDQQAAGGSSSEIAGDDLGKGKNVSMERLVTQLHFESAKPISTLIGASEANITDVDGSDQEDGDGDGVKNVTRKVIGHEQKRKNARKPFAGDVEMEGTDDDIEEQEGNKVAADSTFPKFYIPESRGRSEAAWSFSLPQDQHATLVQSVSPLRTHRINLNGIN
jgi:hypothetical protein